MAGFKEFIEMYTVYGLPKEIVPFQYFTNSDIPVLIQSANFYTSLMMSAPQLKGKWKMTPALGTQIANQLNIDTFIGGLALTISEKSKQPQAAWEYIKWLTSTPVQIELAKAFMEQIQGTMFIPANKEAMSKIPILPDDARTLQKQAQGSRSSIYGLVAPRNRRRYLQMAAQEVILLGTDPETAIRKAASEHNEEIRKKNVEYERFIKKLLEKQ